ncbi:MAG: protein kinase domain-containing protein [Pseudomarimonas sp.]
MNTPNSALLARSLALFDELIELSTSERNARLAALEANEPALADAVAKLLTADAEHSGLLDRGVDGIAHTLLSELSEHTLSLQRVESGMQIAAFTLQRQLGVGGMGEVWLAQRSSGDFVQDVALKLLKRGMDSDEISRRFVRERRILADLNHPHIAGFIDGGVSADGRLYFAMEYVDGVPITTFAREQALSVRASMQLLVAVCEAVAYAQSHLVVHRDLKPSNILIDTSGQPRVLDFGIAKLIGESVADTVLTASGMRMLSPAYAAPEQVLDEPISTATDVYSLGVLAFELLTNQLPHSRSGNMVALADQVRDETTHSPSAAIRHRAGQPAAATAGVSQPRAAREVAGDLDVIVLTALRREPARRYANAAALADDLKRWLDGRPIAAQADTAGYRMRKFVARNRLAVGSASAVLLALIAGFGVALWQASVAREHARSAQMQLRRAETINAFTQSLFREQDPFARTSAVARTPSELIATGINRAKVQFADDDALRIGLLEDLAGIQVALGEFATAETHLREALQARSNDGSAAAVGARTRSMLALALAGNGQIDAGLAEAKAAAVVLREQLGADDPETIRADARWLRLWLPTGTFDELASLGSDVSDRATRVFGEAAPETLAIAADQTSILERFDKYTDMQTTLLDVVARIERHLGNDHGLLVRPLARLGDLQRILANNEAAQPFFDRAIAIARERAHGTVTGTLLLRRGDNFRRLGNWEAAKADFSESASLLPPNSAELAQLEQLRGVLANRLGDREAALAHLRDSKIGFERALGKPSIYSWSSALAMVGIELEHAIETRTKPSDEVLQTTLAAEKAMRELSPPPSFDVFLAVGTLAQVEAARGEIEPALGHFAEAIEMGSTVYSASHPSVLDLRLKRAEVLPATRADEARAELQEIADLPELDDALRERAEAGLAKR